MNRLLFVPIVMVMGSTSSMQAVNHNTRPFQGDYEEIEIVKRPDGTRNEVKRFSKLFRDSRGRLRQECTITKENGEELPTVVFLIDFARGQIRLLDLKSGEQVNQATLPTSSSQIQAVLAAAGAPMRPPGHSTAPPEAPKFEDLGEKQIEGLSARGMRTTTGDTISEIWTAAAIDQPSLLSRTLRPDREETKRLFNIKLDEPDPALFAPLDSPQ